MATRPDEYLSLHGGQSFVRGTEQVFDWYRPCLPPEGRILDWGCRHAPDACLVAAEFGAALSIDGCDVVDEDSYLVFHEAARLNYTKLNHPYVLPYDDSSFDGIIAAGVLEHVPMEYESLKELSRVMKDGGVLVISYLPNSWSWHEFRARQSANDITSPGDAHHLRTYRPRRVRELLQSVGFVQTRVGYQTHFDLLALEPQPSRRRRAVSWLGRRVGMAQVSPCLAIIARRVNYL